MKKGYLTFALPALIAGLFFFGFNSGANGPTEIRWDEWGVPHIKASGDEELFYAFGWAQMHHHGDLILKLYTRSRGQAAELLGQDELTSDMLVHAMGFPELAAKWEAEQPEDMRRNLAAFARGLNDYASKHPGTLDEGLKSILPFSAADVIAHQLFVVYSRFVAGDDLGQAQYWGRRGSNTYAVSPSRAAAGKAMLVQNPHLPWYDEFTWMEADLRGPDSHVYGATLVGLPILGIAFNENLGWSHTNNTIDPTDLYLLKLKDGGYLLDGEVRSFEVRKKVLKVKTADGVVEKEIPLLRSVHGPVVVQKGEEALALRLPTTDRPLLATQWQEMGRAKNFSEFEAAISKLQIPFFNIMYADKAGNIFYMFNGHVPRRPEKDWAFWNDVVPGDESKYLWNDILTYDELPKVKNPASGWLQNANDPPWTCTFPRVFEPNDYPAYLAPVNMGFRPQRSARMLAEDESITFDELVAYKHSTRLEFADRILDDLFAAIDAHGSETAKKAKAVLEQWDRQTDADSRGAVLFVMWAREWGVWNQANYAQPWKMEAARTTPDGIADPERAVKVLEGVATQLEAGFGALDVPWGEVMRLRWGKYDLPSNGADGSVGVFRVNWHDQDEDGRFRALGGDSWVGVIEFGDRVRAKVLLSYGNSSDPDSPHFGDQLELFSKKELRDAWFYEEDLQGHIVRTEVLSEGGFVEK